MPTGDQADIASRLRAVLPRGWFPDDAPVLAALLSGMASAWASIYSGVIYAGTQTRIATATTFWLDGAATDYLGTFPRRLNEPDAAYSLRIRKEIIRARNTRAAISQAVLDLTGNAPSFFQPSKVTDTGAWGAPTMAWGMAGGWGSLAVPFQSFLTITRGTAPGAGGTGSGAFGLSGYGSPLGGWGVGTFAWGDDAPAQGGVTDDDIYAAVAGCTPAGHINWVRLTGPRLPRPYSGAGSVVGSDYVA